MSNVTASPSLKARVGNPALVGTLLLCAAGTMFLAALGGSYWAVHAANRGDFVTKGMKFNIYGGAVLAITAMLGSIAVEFAMSGVKQGETRWASMGWTLAAGFGISCMSIVWYLAKSLPFGVNESPYSVLLYSMFAGCMIMLSIGTGAVILAFARTRGGQITADQPAYGRATTWIWHLAMISSVMTFSLVYLYK